MLFNLVYSVPEVTEHVEDGEIVRVTKVHTIFQPIEISIDLETRNFNVTEHKPTITVDVREEVVGFPVYTNSAYRGLLNQ